MTKGFVRVGHAVANMRRHEKRSSSTCSNGGFYTSPTNGQVITSDSLNITWNTGCLNTTAVDIYLYAFGASSTYTHIWESVDYSNGAYEATLQSQWWNSTSPINLQLSIVQHGDYVFMNPYSAGPVFISQISSNSSSSSSTSSSSDTITNVNNVPSSGSSLSGGKIAAAVIVPLLVIGFGIAAYFWYSRKKSTEKRKRFSEALDKRMSVISTDWKSLSAAGASAAIRNSVALPGSPGNRNSSFAFGVIQPNGSVLSPDDDDTPQQMSQLRPGLRTSAFGNRVSRVSFASDVRGPADRNTVVSRSFHVGFAPQELQRQNSDEMSPTQTVGPFSLSTEDIQAHLGGNSPLHSNTLFDEPADMTGPAPSFPVPVHFPPGAPVGMMPSNVLTPDDMLRVYASRKSVAPSLPEPITFPEPAVNYNGNGMRTLYSPPPTAGLEFSDLKNPYLDIADVVPPEN